MRRSIGLYTKKLWLIFVRIPTCHDAVVVGVGVGWVGGDQTLCLDASLDHPPESTVLGFQVIPPDPIQQHHHKSVTVIAGSCVNLSVRHEGRPEKNQAQPVWSYPRHFSVYMSRPNLVTWLDGVFHKGGSLSRSTPQSLQASRSYIYIEFPVSPFLYYSLIIRGSSYCLECRRLPLLKILIEFVLNIVLLSDTPPRIY